MRPEDTRRVEIGAVSGQGAAGCVVCLAEIARQGGGGEGREQPVREVFSHREAFMAIVFSVARGIEVLPSFGDV
ncbi:MAG: hypothetical protein N2512_00645 [Armatimonadetes bacterium]|nr:hypothetical protein [Armatimonadota bacterium]